MTSPDPLHCLVPSSRPLSPTGEGELSGVRAAVKDCVAVAGHRSSFGHPRWRETHAAAVRDAEVLARLRHRGVSIIGLTKMDQLAYSLIGNAGEGAPPLNPHDPACFCGGSSSGSAAAVAGGSAELGVGTDTAGSIRVPAAACGLYGLRPTHGRLSVDGVIPLAPSLDVVGFLARRPDLLGRALVAAAPEQGGQRLSLRRLLLPAGLDDACGRRVAAALGGSAERVDVSELVSSEVGDLMARIQGREIWATHGAWAAQHIDALAPDVQVRLRRCAALSRDPQAEIDTDLAARAGYRAAVTAIVGDDGVLVMPVLPRRGPRLDWAEEELLTFRLECFRLTAPSSLAGLPQLVLGGGLGTGPAISLIGPPLSEHSLLALAPAKTPAGDADQP